MPGSSYGVHFVNDKEEFESACKDAFFYDGRGKILVEKVIKGFEIGCAVREMKKSLQDQWMKLKLMVDSLILKVSMK